MGIRVVLISLGRCKSETGRLSNLARVRHSLLLDLGFRPAPPPLLPVGEDHRGGAMRSEGESLAGG